MSVAVTRDGSGISLNAGHREWMTDRETRLILPVSD
jgi:hypothetical protein